MKITLQKQSDAYYPFDDEAVELTNKKPENSLYVVDIKQSRNPAYHRRALKMLRLMFDMTDECLTFEPWRKMLTIKAGYFTAIGSVDINGTVSSAVIPDSLSFENMEEAEFKECYQALHRAFCEKYGKLLTNDQLEEWSRM